MKRDCPNIVSIRHAKNMGQLAAFETGIRESTGDLIFFLDADDIEKLKEELINRKKNLK